MTDLSDQQLLDRCTPQPDRQAIGELARRYIGLVHAVASAQLRDHHLADDIVQAVFIVLTRKAHTLRNGVVLPAWLITVTRHAVANARRMHSRQRAHETRKAVMQRTTVPPPELPDEEIGRLYDAITTLPRIDRDAVVLHYLQDKSHREVGASLGLTEDAARKRSARALDRLRGLLASRGVVASLATIAVTLKTESTRAAALSVTQIDSIVNIAVLSHSVESTGTASAIAKGVAHMLTATKLKLAAASLAVATAATVAAIPVVSRWAQSPTTPPPVVVSFQNTTNPTETANLVAQIDANSSAELLGISAYPPSDDSWFNASGQPIPRPDIDFEAAQVSASPEPEHIAAFRIKHPSGATTRTRILDANMSANSQTADETGVSTLVSAFTLSAPAASTSFEIGFATEDWKPLATTDKPAQGERVSTKRYGEITFAPVADDNGRARLVIEQFEEILEPNVIFAYDDKNQPHKPDNVNVHSDGNSTTTTVDFDLPVEKITRFAIMTRNYSRMATFNAVSLKSGVDTRPTVTVRDVPPGK